MSEIFVALIDMSITAVWLILAVLVLRLIMKRTPKALICLLWALVAVRLMLPLSIQSDLSLVPNTTEVTERFASAVYSPTQFESTPENGGTTDISQDTLPILPESETSGNNMLDGLLSALPYVWLVGCVGMLLHALVGYIRIRRKTKVSIKLHDNIRLCDDIQSPFVVGGLCPKIYLPSSMTAEHQRYVLAHERSHIKRGDQLWKPLGYLLLSVYWFNPLMWVSYILFSRDIEMACDERVISTMSVEDKKNYSLALLMCSMPKRQIAAYPLAFGEVGVKQRVSSVVKYRKPTFWVTFVSVVIGLAVSVLFMTDPKTAVKAVDAPAVNDDLISSETTVTDGGLQYIHYICPHDDERRGSTLSLVPSENKFTFSLSYENGYTCFGYYTESEGTVVATAQEGNRMVFNRNGNSLVFVAGESDPIPTYYEGDNTALPDSTAFVLTD